MGLLGPELAENGHTGMWVVEQRRIQWKYSAVSISQFCEGGRTFIIVDTTATPTVGLGGSHMGSDI